MAKPRLNVSGWINLNHSFSVVAQNHLYWLAKSEEFDLRLHQPEFPVKAWENSSVAPGWDSESREVLRSIPLAEPTPDIPLLNFSYPFDTLIDIPNQVRFIVTEFGLVKSNLRSLESLEKLKALKHVITPSQWSKQRLVDMGFNANSIAVVPHGYNPSVYYPAGPEERAQVRANLGVKPHEFCICNVGALTWNKGIDILLDAVYQVWREHKNVRLILKDAHSLFRISGQEFVLNHVSRQGMDVSFLSAVRVISSDLSPQQLRELYVGADLYLSPYRAEGFNLPALEAAACGTEVLCTGGGASDSYIGIDFQVKADLLSTSHAAKQLISEMILPEKGAFLLPNPQRVSDKVNYLINRKNRSSARTFNALSNSEITWKVTTQHLTNVILRERHHHQNGPNPPGH